MEYVRCCCSLAELPPTPKHEATKTSSIRQSAFKRARVYASVYSVEQGSGRKLLGQQTSLHVFHITLNRGRRRVAEKSVVY